MPQGLTFVEPRRQARIDSRLHALPVAVAKSVVGVLVAVGVQIRVLRLAKTLLANTLYA